MFRLDGGYYAVYLHHWWASNDGVEWRELESAPDSVPAEFGAHGVDVRIFEAADGGVWAILESPDGTKSFRRSGGEWLEIPATAIPPERQPGFSEMTSQPRPVATDFGWMKMTFGGSRKVFDPNDLALYLSGDGDHWENVIMPKLGSNWQIPVPLPVKYQAGLFVRMLPGPRVLVGRFAEQS